MVTAGQTEAEQGVAGVGLDLGRQHSTRSLPGLPNATAPFQNHHLAAGRAELPGARGPDGAAADYDYVVARRHLDRMKLFETSGRTAA